MRVCACVNVCVCDVRVRVNVCVCYVRVRASIQLLSSCAHFAQSPHGVLAALELKRFCNWGQVASGSHAISQLLLELRGFNIQQGMVMDFARAYMIASIEGNVCRSRRLVEPGDVSLQIATTTSPPLHS
jgi:hypothetical protein